MKIIPLRRKLIERKIFIYTNVCMKNYNNYIYTYNNGLDQLVK